MPSTSRGYPYPSGSDDVDIPGDIQALADAVNTDVGTIATTTPSAPVLQTLADAAGDLAVGSAADTFGRLALGTDNYALTVNTGGAGVAKIGWEDPTANPLTVTAMALKVNTATVGNLLTANQASVETDTTGLGVASAATVARSTAQAKVGSASLLVTSTAVDASAGAAGTPRATSGVAVTPGVTYTGTVSVLNGVGTRTLQVRLLWWDAGGSYLSLTDGTTAAAPAAWATLRATGVAPATAAFVSIEANMVDAGSIGDAYYSDCWGFWEGAGGQWALPGTPITNLGYYTDESVGRRLFQWDANNSRWQQTFGDTGWRDVTGSIAAGLAATNPTLTLYVRRHGIRVSWLLFEGAAGTATGLVNILAAVPAGFNQTPAVSTYAAYPLMNYATGQVTLESVYMSSFDMSTAGWTTIRHTGSWSYTTTDAWPTTLPGTASGSIPA